MKYAVYRIYNLQSMGTIELCLANESLYGVIERIGELVYDRL